MGSWPVVRLHTYIKDNVQPRNTVKPVCSDHLWATNIVLVSSNGTLQGGSSSYGVLGCKAGFGVVYYIVAMHPSF